MNLLSAAEWSAVMCGIAYLLLAIRENRKGWIFGGISTAIYMYVMYESRLFADMLLNSFYTLMAVKGYLEWGKTENTLPISILPNKTRWILAFATLSGAGILGYLFQKFTEADYPFADSFIAATAVTATWLSTQKKMENWAVWIISNSSAILLFYIKGLMPTVFLTLIYLVLAIAGWLTWNKKWRSA